MKKALFCVVLLFVLTGAVHSQSIYDWNWAGLVRLRPLATIIPLMLGGFEIVADWVPYVSPNVGIPIEIDFAYILDIPGFGMMAGIEAVPLRHKEKSGLYITGLAGPFFIDGSVFFMARANIGYQIVANSGFVFTPAIGAKYNSLLKKFSADLMLDIGFAYRRRR